ncbi:MAG: SusD/RagB family nutrient-binding outer membrane lipoprotein [Gammaproteobacteria bacterium]|nr:MAG: SusD/RagB family nutrient-binding outer membrane lipoprotein [Gammaproteobacteria bacterium]
MKKAFFIIACAFALSSISSCKKFLDINTDPDRLAAEQTDIAQLLTSVTANVGFTGGSDLQRFSALIAQQYSGQSTGAQNQTQDYEKYLITGSDVNNLFGSIYATTLNDIEVIIRKANAENSPHYSGVAKILKAYTYQISVDAWGDLPYSEAEKERENLTPKYDDDEQLYKNLISLLDQGIAEVGASSSTRSPGANSLIYPESFATAKTKWIKFANTLKLRIYLHYSKFDRNFMVTQITSLVNSGAQFMASNADNFEMPFANQARRQNPIHQFELDRPNYLMANATLVDSMNVRQDPRRFTYFTQFPARSGNFKGAKAGDAASQLYSRLHVFLRGDTTNNPTPVANGSYSATSSTTGYTYTGDAPVRMLTYAEYNFIRAEAALYGAPGDPQTFFQEGIKASMTMARVPVSAPTATVPGTSTAYVTANGLLLGTADDKLKRIITEKFIANYGVVMEPWTDWRRTGYPAINKAGNAVIADIPRSLLYPQNEIDLNPNAPKQKSSMLERVFWDK